MSLKGTVWAPMGPSPISEGGSEDNGLVSAIAIHPSNPHIIYIGTAGGGAWRSGDDGATWKPLFDRQLSLGVGEPGALAIDPGNTDTIYIGTSARINAEPQAGLFKSIDAGASWVQLGSGFPAGNVGNASLFTSLWVNVIIVDPANSNTVYLGCSAGVLVSNDGGLNWTFGSNAGGDARSLALDPSSPPGARILYAGISGRGAFTSTNGGQTWTQILSGSTPVVSAAVGPAPQGFGKVIIALAPPASPPNPGGIQVLYVTLQGTGGAPDPVGVFLSTDQGSTWTQRSATGMPKNTQGGYSFHMAVDPASPGDGSNDIIYFGAVGQAKSTDSGATFSGLTGLHADTHAWAFTPQPSPTPSVVFSGNDGGLAKSTDGGATWTHLSKGGLQTSLFYNIDIKPDATASVTVGALQDNEIETTSGGSGLGWVATSGGDGWDAAYDGQIAGQVYSTSGFWFPAPCTRVFKSTDDGASFPTEITPWGTTSDAGCYLAPIGTDPSTGGIVYVSGNQNLWQSQDSGGTWRIILPLTTTGRIDVSEVNGNNVVVATGGQVFVSTNALAATVGPPSGVTFTNITRNLPGRNVARAAFDPADPTIIYAVLGGFNGAGPGQTGHVFRTTIGGTAWTDISPALNVPFSALALDGTDTPTTIYVGTEFGVLRSVDVGASWTVLDDIHFPRVPVLDLAYNKKAGMLRAATYGRGVFQFIKPKGPAISVNLQDSLAFGTVCKGPTFLTLQVFNVGATDLVINSVQRLMGSPGFVVMPTPGTPVTIAAGEELDFTVAFIPTTPGTLELAIIRIASNDPTAPVVDLLASGLGGTAILETAIANTGKFRDTCLGSFAEEELVISNGGTCPMTIFGVTSSSAEFQVPNVVSYPLTLSAGNNIALPLRFQPFSLGAKSATITVSTNAGSRSISVSGMVPAPRLVLIIADSGDLGHACVGCFVDRPLTLTNAGQCTLSITGISSSSAEFIVPEVRSYPITIGAGDAMTVPIRFQPTSLGAKSAVITVTSDDPAGPQTLNLSASAPSGKLTVTGSTKFGSVKLGHCEEKTIAICNTGKCTLHVRKVFVKQFKHHFKLVHNPFPADLAPGSCLNLVIRFRATCNQPCPACLIIKSDDPDRPVRRLEITGHTCHNLCSSTRCWLACKLRGFVKLAEDCDDDDCHEEDDCCEEDCCDDDDDSCDDDPHGDDDGGDHDGKGRRHRQRHHHHRRRNCG